ncbi:hypothetical protein J2Y48_003044 [Mycoplana sp. BE70]|uniref:BA14K family protein n=1 Tax=Mycoplana sp. BE70 TaxID=2817775 RepID=UPI0028589167|nr:BA14K family protein [Mycoplana sp. BE70]MDR6757747.1 hypothetical protein [Mycoplana sp. BE70]
MNKFFKTAVLAAAVTGATLTTSGLAEARDRHHHHNNNDAAWAAGAAGLVTGVIVGGAIANSGPAYYDDGYYAPRRVYVEPEYRPVRRVYRARPAYVGAYEPWSAGWYRYCGDTYRSFNPNTGTFRGYDGLEHFCVAG